MYKQAQIATAIACGNGNAVMDKGFVKHQVVIQIIVVITIMQAKFLTGVNGKPLTRLKFLWIIDFTPVCHSQIGVDNLVSGAGQKIKCDRFIINPGQ